MLTLGWQVRIRIFDLELDEWNSDEAARHGVRDAEIRQVLDNEPVFLPNKKGHQAPLIMIGPTNGGRMLTVPLGPTAHDAVWRPASAWDSSRGERSRYDAALPHHPSR
jgi:uncharacterized DUF497 family protein